MSCNSGSAFLRNFLAMCSKRLSDSSLCRSAIFVYSLKHFIANTLKIISICKNKVFLFYPCTTSFDFRRSSMIEYPSFTRLTSSSFSFAISSSSSGNSSSKSEYSPSEGPASKNIFFCKNGILYTFNTSGFLPKFVYLVLKH